MSANGNADSTANGAAESNGKGDDKVRVAIIGVGNCSNSLLQGVEYYKDAPDDKFVPGLMHVNLGGYHVSDIEFVAAFDVVKGKVGVDLAEAIWRTERRSSSRTSRRRVTVSRGMTHDGTAYSRWSRRAGETDDVVGILKERKVDVVVNTCRSDRRRRPSGMPSRCSRRLRDGQLHAGLHRPRGVLAAPLEQAGLPIIGDDISHRSAPRYAPGC
jgi:myo-inositol-1-phosphate synthase